MAEKQARRTIWNRLFFVLLILLSMALIYLALILPLLKSTLTPTPEIGQVALQTYRAPRTTSYISEERTDELRRNAERAVPPVYTDPDTKIARQQMERLRAALAYISSVHADPYATNNQKIEDLAALEDVSLSPESVSTILGLTDSRWQAIQQETLIVLEKMMSSAIRPENLAEARKRAPAVVSLSLPEGQAAVVAELAAAFVAPNSEYSESLTEQAREQARQAVEPVERQFIAGQTVVSQGQVLSGADIEALQQLDLVQPEQNWQDLASVAALVLLVVAFLIFYLRQEQAAFISDTRGLGAMAVLFVVFLLGARAAIPAHFVLPYVIPLAAFSLTIAALYNSNLAMITSLILAVLVAYEMPDAAELSLYYVMSCLFGILTLGRARRITSFFLAGAIAAIAGAIIVLVYQLTTADWGSLAILVGVAFFNGLASASLAILLQFFLAQLLGMISPMQLMDLSRPDNALLQMLLREAPGTYQHSLQVANLAEQAAEKIGADALLTRVGALYHDVGKAQNPAFFIENQPEGFANPHDRLDPYESSQIIREHITEGYTLGHKHRLPRRILDFILEHHGTMITRYQYISAVNAEQGDESQVDKSSFRYPGPRPGSRETAILMLADGSEARIRAEKPADEARLKEIIKQIVEQRIALGQLDDTDLTMKDLTTIIDSFTATMRGIYHPRVKYPQLDKRAETPDAAPEATPEPAQEAATDAAAPAAAEVEAQALPPEEQPVPVDLTIDAPSEG